MLVTRACAFEVLRSSPMDGNAPFTVNGISVLSCVQLPTEIYAVARLRAGRFTRPDTLPVFMVLVAMLYTSALGLTGFTVASGNARYIAGDFSQGVIGVRSDIKYTVLNDHRVI